MDISSKIEGCILAGAIGDAFGGGYENVLKNDEVYVGALSVLISIRSALNRQWDGTQNLLQIIIEQIPDTKVRDRIIEINEIQYTRKLQEIEKLGNDGYVVNSIPLAIVAASKVNEILHLTVQNDRYDKI